MCPYCERAELRCLGTRTRPRGVDVPVPCAQAPRVKAALEESAAVPRNALGTYGRVRGWVPAAPSWWRAWSPRGAAAQVGGSRGIRTSRCACSGPQDFCPGWGGGGVREAGGARRGGPPRDVAVPLRLEMPEGASLEQGPGKTAAAGNSAFAGELKKGLLRLWFGDQTPGTRPECLRPRSEVSLPMSEGTEFLTMGCVFF